MYMSLVGVTWEMEHTSDTIQSSLRLSLNPRPPCLAVCLRGGLYVHSVPLNTWVIFPLSHCLESS